jgi:hypothetical protein
MADLGRHKRDWLFLIGVPTIDLRDALINGVASSSRALTEPPPVSIRNIEVMDDRDQPSLALHLRTRTAVPATEAWAVAQRTLTTYAPNVDLSGVKIIVTGNP